ncbi:outer membrane protein assembly factor BamC [Gammaproteobacteria bacterium]|nr:outer membrane protein assembly factor BamC [Gammaproteobacteria bacterium]
MNKYFASFLLLFTLSGCAGMSDYVKNVISDPRNEKLVYKTDEDYSSGQIDLIIPPNLSQPKTKDALLLPEVIDNDSNKLFTIDTKLDGIKLFKQGQDMFLSVKTEDKILLWERIKSFWLEEGFQILNEDLPISSMRTNYLENLSEVQLGIIQRYVGRYVPLLVSPETRDSYKTRIVKKENGFDVLISHYGKEFMSDGDTEFKWQNRPRDKEFQNEMISRMYIYLGGDEAKNSGYIVAKTTGIRKTVSIYTDEQGLQTLFVPDIYERVYPSVISSLDILGVKIIEKDQSSGLIKVSLDDREKEAKGFLSSLFSSDSSEVMNIKVNVGGETGESTLITIEDNVFNQIQNLASDEVLRGLYIKLR